MKILTALCALTIALCVTPTARSWDTHDGNFKCLRTLLPRLDFC